jgi:hypothetical protein
MLRQRSAMAPRGRIDAEPRKNRHRLTIALSDASRAPPKLRDRVALGRIRDVVKHLLPFLRRLAGVAGLDSGAARERVRVARALGALPRLAQALARGELSYSKVRALTRVATPETEERLLAVGKAGMAEHVERIVRGWPGAPGERYQVVVHVDAAALADPDALGRSVLQDGTHVSAETSRRLACDASRVVMRHAPDGRVVEVGARTRTIHPLSCRRFLRTVQARLDR